VLTANQQPDHSRISEFRDHAAAAGGGRGSKDHSGGTARESDAPTAEQTELNRKAEIAEAKAKAARDKAIEAAENTGVEPSDLEPLAVEAMPRRGLARKADGTPTRKIHRNFTDPDSHLMQSGGSYLQGYNCQVAVDSGHQVIVAVGVSNQPPDAGYWSEDNAKACGDQGIDAYITTGRLLHGPPPPSKRRPLPEMPMPEPAWPAS
jgi:hypothetical protein